MVESKENYKFDLRVKGLRTKVFGNCYTITYEHLDAEIQIPEQSLSFFGPKYNITYMTKRNCKIQIN